MIWQMRMTAARIREDRKRCATLGISKRTVQTCVDVRYCMFFCTSLIYVLINEDDDNDEGGDDTEDYYYYYYYGFKVRKLFQV